MAGLNDPDFWPKVADTIGSNHHYTYDLGDYSHLLDVVQIVCQAAAKLFPEKQYDVEPSGADHLAEMMVLAEQRDAVLDLHEPTDLNSYGIRSCDECSDPEEGSYVRWPCPTVTALGVRE